MLNYGRSMAPQIKPVVALVSEQPACVASDGLTRAHIAAVSYYGNLRVLPARHAAFCKWVIADVSDTPDILKSWPTY